MKPAARRTRLVVRELPDELVVYDLDRHEAHCLNRTAAIVFRGANGTRSLDDLGLLLGDGLDRAERGVAVRMALDLLGQAHLLESGEARWPAPEDLSRRSVLRRAGLGAALLLPAVASVVVPTPAEAAVTCTTDCLGGSRTGLSCNCPSSITPPPCDNVCFPDGTCGGSGFCP